LSKRENHTLVENTQSGIQQTHNHENQQTKNNTIQYTATGPQTHTLSQYQKTPREIGKPGLYARKKDWLHKN